MSEHPDPAKETGATMALGGHAGASRARRAAPPWALEHVRGLSELKAALASLVARQDGHEIICTERHSHNADKFDAVARSFEEHIDQRAAHDRLTDGALGRIDDRLVAASAASEDRAKEIRGVIWRGIFIVLGVALGGIGTLLFATFRKQMGVG